ncbi:MAG: malate synthase G, partial [Sulfitobacter sp.]
MKRLDRKELQVDAQLAEFIEDQALNGLSVSADVFWSGFSELVHGLGPKNRALLEKRSAIQGQIDEWHRARKGQAHDAVAYTAFLKEIGYLVPEGAP